jgi:small subunit ribosomal protein S24e
MEIHLLDQKENKLVKRKEIKFSVAFLQAPPKKAELKAEVGKALNAAPDNVAIRRLRNVFGMRKSIGFAYVYENVDDLKKNETRPILKRMGFAVAEKKKKVKGAAAKKEGAK